MDNPEQFMDACCGECVSMFHATADHPADGPLAFGDRDEFPPGYDPGEADRLIGRAVDPA